MVWGRTQPHTLTPPAALYIYPEAPCPLGEFLKLALQESCGAAGAQAYSEDWALPASSSPILSPALGCR